jgi:hypothetical protein
MRRPPPVSPNRPRSFDEPRVRPLLAALAATLRVPERGGLHRVLFDELREALALRPLRGGAFTSRSDLFSELMAHWTEDATRLERLVAAPEGALAAHVARAVRRLGRDVGVKRRNPHARFQKSLAAALRGEQRTPQPRLDPTPARLRLLPAAGPGPHPWPGDVDDPTREGFLSHRKLVSATLAALAEAPGHALTRRELRQAIGRRYALDATRAEPLADADALADPRAPSSDAVHFDPALRARELLPLIPPADARFWVACSEALAAGEGALPSAAAIAQRVGCSEKTVQRWMERARQALAPLTQTTSVESMQRYLHAIAALLRTRR